MTDARRPDAPEPDATAVSHADTADLFERLLARSRTEPWVLQLYISGMSPRSLSAIHALREICDTHLAAGCSLTITDIYEQRDVAREHQIFASPTLVRHSPLPVRRLVGDLSNRDLVLRTLDLA